MTEQQFNHYIKGGLFEATYNPKNKHDLVEKEALLKFGRKITAYQNMIITPIQESIYKGQFRFNADEVYGWFPECDIYEIKIIDEYIEDVEPLPVYMYRMTFTKKSQIFPNFGKGYDDIEFPFYVYREYACDTDDYILKLADPLPTRIEKYVWYGKFNEEIKWEVIYDNRRNNSRKKTDCRV